MDIFSLYKDLYYYIFNKLDDDSLEVLSLTSKKFHELISDNYYLIRNPYVSSYKWKQHLSHKKHYKECVYYCNKLQERNWKYCDDILGELQSPRLLYKTLTVLGFPYPIALCSHSSLLILILADEFSCFKFLIEAKFITIFNKAELAEYAISFTSDIQFRSYINNM